MGKKRGKEWMQERLRKIISHDTRLTYKQNVWLWLLAVMVVLLCSFGAYAYYSFQTECKKVALRGADNISQMVVAQVDERLNNLRQYYISRATEDSVRWVIENDMDYSDYEHIKEAQDAFASKTYLSGYVDSYTFVNYRTDWVISNKGLYKLQEAENQELLETYFTDAEQKRDKYYWVYDETAKITNKVNRLYRTTIETGGLNYVMRLPYGINPYAMLIVNVNMTTWQSWIQQQLEAGDEIVVIGENNKVIYATSRVLAEEAVKEAENISQRAVPANGTKYMGAYSTSGVLGWQYYVFHDIAKEKNDFKYSWVWITCILLLTGLAFVVAAYMIYQPVRNLVKDVSSGEGQEEGKAVGNELDFLAGSLKTLRSDNHYLQDMVNQNQSRLLELFELRLVRGEVRRQDEWREYMEDFGLREKNYFATVVVVLDLREEEEEQSNVKEDVICLQLVSQMPESIRELAWMPPIYNACTIFAIFAENDEYRLLERIEAYYRELQQYSEEVSGYRLLMGVSTNHTDYKHIQAAYRESIMALTGSLNNLDDRRNTREQMENCHFYLSSSTMAPGNGYDDTYEKEIQAGIKAMDKNQCYQTTDKFCSLVSRMGGDSASQVMVYMLRYVNAILVTAMEAHVKLEEIYPQGLRKLYAEILEALEPSRERRYIKANIIDPILAARDELMNQKAYSILQDIENLIASKKGNITLTECADILGVHPTYIWKVLKMEKGKSFTDCLEEYKIEEAKHLLLNSSLSVAEIAAELNYTNAQNFIRFFSKSTGVTPGKFRKLY